MDCAIDQRSKVQGLYDACNVVFSQKELPTFQQIHWLKNLLGIAPPSINIFLRKRVSTIVDIISFEFRFFTQTQ